MNDFSNVVKVIKGGTTDIKKIYKGSTVIWTKPAYNWVTQTGSVLEITGAMTKSQTGATLSIS